MVAVSQQWSLPSQSPYIRRALYLAEGTSIGSGISIVFLFVLRWVVFLLSSNLFNVLTIGSLFLLAVISVIFVRNTVFVKWAHHTSSDSNYPPEYQDWQETRQWPWVAAVAFITSVILLGVSIFLWGWLRALSGWSQAFISGVTIAGLSLYWYIFYKLGTNLLHP